MLKETEFFYNSRGQRSKMIKANGNQVTNSFFEDGLVKTSTERTATSKGDQLVALHKLDYTADGDRSVDVSRVDVAGAEGYLNQTAKYAYTPAGQLAAVTKTGADAGDSESYVYDAAGNISSQTMTKPAGAATTTAYNYERNRLQFATVSGATTNFQYDPFGRTSTSTYGATGNLAERYGYDGFDRVVKHEKFAADGVTNQVTKSSVFDPFDRTTQQTSKVGAAAAKQTRFVYLGVTDQVVSEEQKDAAGVWKVAKSYTYGPGGERLSLSDTPVDGSAGSTSYYGTNPHTDTETLTSESTGQTVATYRYTAYGTADEKGTTGLDKVENDPVKDADVVNPYRFNGKRFDGATGSYDMGFRDYSPGLNRFTTRDMYNGALADVALGTDRWNTNRYAFAGGNPVTGIELDGHRRIGFGGEELPLNAHDTTELAAVDSIYETAPSVVGPEAASGHVSVDVGQGSGAGQTIPSMDGGPEGRPDIMYETDTAIYLWEVKKSTVPAFKARRQLLRYQAMLQELTDKEVHLGWDLPDDEGESSEGHVRMFSNGEFMRPDGIRGRGRTIGVRWYDVDDREDEDVDSPYNPPAIPLKPEVGRPSEAEPGQAPDPFGYGLDPTSPGLEPEHAMLLGVLGGLAVIGGFLACASSGGAGC